MRVFIAVLVSLLFAVLMSCTQQLDSNEVDAMISEAISTYAAGLPTETPIPTKSPSPDVFDALTARRIDIVDDLGDVKLSLSSQENTGGIISMYSPQQDLTIRMLATMDESGNSPMFVLRNGEHSTSIWANDDGTTFKAGETDYRTDDDLIAGVEHTEVLRFDTFADGLSVITLGDEDGEHVTLSTSNDGPIWAWYDDGGVLRQLIALDDDGDPVIKQKNASGDDAVWLGVYKNAGAVAVYDDEGNLVDIMNR